MFDWLQYSSYAEEKLCKRSTVLFRQGDKAGGFYYLKEGEITISVLRQDGFERIIDFVYPGSLLGEQMLYNRASFTTAKVQVDSVLYFFSESQFELLRKKHPEVSREFGNSLIQKIRLLANINRILIAPVDVQLAFFLLNLYQKKKSKMIHINQTSISNYIGKSRVSVWKVLKEWRDENIVEVNNYSFVLKNIEKLKEKTKDL